MGGDGSGTLTSTSSSANSPSTAWIHIGSSDSDGNGYGGLLHKNKNQDDDGVCVSMEVDGGLANKRIAQLRSDALRFVDYDGVPKRILVRKRNKRRRVLVAAVACHEMDDGEVGEVEEVEEEEVDMYLGGDDVHFPMKMVDE